MKKATKNTNDIVKDIFQFIVHFVNPTDKLNFSILRQVCEQRVLTKFFMNIF